MKNILILTTKAFANKLEYIYLILKKKYLGRYQIETLESMVEGQIFDYVYLIISKTTPENEKISLIIQSKIWIQNDTTIVPIHFETISNCEEKFKKREENKLKRNESKLKKTYPILWNAN